MEGQRNGAVGELLAGDPLRVGPYEISGRLGEGGMGAVYLGRDPGGRRVAVKVVRPELARDAGFAARFEDEVANARRVASFCTAQVLDHGIDDGRAYMVTEYIDGVSLLEYVRENGALSPGMLHGVAVGVAAALVAIHTAGLIHRDLKPANVLLSLSGPRVIDFGIARALDAASAHTLTGQLIGSPGWMAPEQIRGERVTTAADIFAWGCLVAYAGNGAHPYGQGDFSLLAYRITVGEVDPAAIPALPAPLNHLVARALAVDPARRPTARELLLALVGGEGENAVLGTLNRSWTTPPQTAPSPAPPTVSQPAETRPGTGVPRSRRGVVAASIGGVALVAAAAVAAGLILMRATNSDAKSGASSGLPTTSSSGAGPVRGPDATGFLYVRLDPAGPSGKCTSEIAKTNPLADDPTPVKAPAGGYCDVLPQMAPDHRLIAFTRNEGAGGHAELWVMWADGSHGFRVTDKIKNGTRAAWSPDDTRLAFTADTSPTQLYVVDVKQNATPEQLTTDPAGATSVSWSKDGRHLAFSSAKSGSTQIYSLDIRTPAAWTQLTTAPVRATNPAWSRDGGQIAFTYGKAGSSDIWVMDADGKHAHAVTTTDSNDQDPCWSPDSSWIGFGRGPGKGPQIWAVHPDGKGLHQITKGSRTEGHPAW